MPRYRKILPTMYGMAAFRKLSGPQANAQSLYVYLLTGPFTSVYPGANVVSPGELAARLKWEAKATDDALKELESTEDNGQPLALVDREAPLIWCPGALLANPPESPNVVKAWASDLIEMPECRVRLEAAHGAIVFLLTSKRQPHAEAFQQALPEGLQEAFPEGYAKPSPNQKQEQKQEQEQEQEQKEEQQPPADPLLILISEQAPFQGKDCFTDAKAREWIKSVQEAFPNVSLETEIRSAANWCLSNPGKGPNKNVKRFLRNWFARTAGRQQATTQEPDNVDLLAWYVAKDGSHRVHVVGRQNRRDVVFNNRYGEEQPIMPIREFLKLYELETKGAGS